MTEPVTRGPVPPTDEQYVVRSLDERIQNDVLRGEWVTLYGGRQTGKTSAMLRLGSAMREAGAIAVYAELSGLRQDANEADFLAEIHSTLTQSLEASDDGTTRLQAPSRFAGIPPYFESFANRFGAERPLVIIMDEVSGVPPTHRSAFFSQLRALQARKAAGESSSLTRLSLVFAGTFDPNALIDSENSPFNVSSEYTTSDADFTLAETEQLANRLAVVTNAGAIHALVSGHPYLTSALLRSVGNGASAEEALQKLIREDLHFRGLSRKLMEVGAETLEYLNRILGGARIEKVVGAIPGIDQLYAFGFLSTDESGRVRIRSEAYSRFAIQYFQAREAGNAPVVPPWSLALHAQQLLHVAESSESESPLVAMICAGMALESALLNELERLGADANDAAQFNAKVKAGDVDLPPISAGKRNNPAAWDLAQMIEIAAIRGLVGGEVPPMAHKVRHWRNLVHPDRVRETYPDGIPIEDASLGVEAASYVLRKLGLR